MDSAEGRRRLAERLRARLGHQHGLRGVKLVAHTGAQQGTSTSMILAPERHAGVVVLANLDGVDVQALSTEILKILLNLKP